MKQILDRTAELIQQAGMTVLILFGAEVHSVQFGYWNADAITHETEANSWKGTWNFLISRIEK